MDDPRVQVFSRLTEAQLRNRLDPSRGVFIAESPKVIRVALDAGYMPLSLLCEEKHIHGDASDIVARLQEQGAEIYTGSRELLASLTGYTLTRGVLCAMRRPAESPLEQVLDKAHRVVVIDGVVDATNIGAIFRSAAALGIDAVLVLSSQLQLAFNLLEHMGLCLAYRALCRSLITFMNITTNTTYILCHNCNLLF